MIVTIDPQHADQRMAAQQGFFLSKFIGPATFNQILMAMIIHGTIPDRPVIRKLEIRETNRIDFLKRLRAMNIHRASLFPDLDGFCQSLRLDLEIRTKEAAHGDTTVTKHPHLCCGAEAPEKRSSALWFDAVYVGPECLFRPFGVKFGINRETAADAWTCLRRRPRDQMEKMPLPGLAVRF